MSFFLSLTDFLNCGKFGSYLRKLGVTLCLTQSPTLHAVEFRAASFNIGAHFTNEGYPDYSLGAPTSDDFIKVREVLRRIDADVIALQEIASADVSGNPDHLDALAADLGYPFIYVAPVSASPAPDSLPGPLDTSLRVAFLSRHPFLSTQAIRSPRATKEITRLHPAVQVDIPGTSRDPFLISAHLKSGTTTADRFRRAVEMRRLTHFLTKQGLTEDDNFIILGDFNLSSSNTTFNTLPSGLPSTFVLGTDISLPISYSTNPLSYFSSPSVTRLDPRQLNGSKATFQSGSVIDLFLVSPSIAGRPLSTEIYNSTHDTSNSLGLPKSGAPLTAGTSAAASDHYAVFGDFELDADFPNLTLTLSQTTVREDAAAETLTITAAIPTPRASPITIQLLSDDPDAAYPSDNTLTLGAGALSASTTLKTGRNFIEDPPRSVSITASAAGYDPASDVLLVTNVDGPYAFTAAGQTLSENFDGFAGAYTPAPWQASGGDWLGEDLGESPWSGFRAYGTNSERAPGFIAETGNSSIRSSFTNQSETVLRALQISFTAEQWRIIEGGTEDSITVDLILAGSTLALPSLTFDAITEAPSEALNPKISAMKNLTIEGLTIPPGASFEIRFNFIQGPGGGPMPNDVFVNEFHYDNTGADLNEFIEVVVAPGFTGSLSDIDILLYNGGNGTVYATHNLGASPFTLGSTHNGFRILSGRITNSIQNGAPDGIALVNRTQGKLLHLLSYEGTFNAISGLPAGANPASIQIPVSQNGNEPVGEDALGLIGSGASRNAFSWAKISGPYSMGNINAGQSLIDTSKRSQGLAIDNLSVTFLTDHDGDGIPDLTDQDNDNDGMPDADELTFGSDPLDAASTYQISYTRPSGTSSFGQLSFPTTPGRSYAVESSPDLRAWTGLDSYAGTGGTRTVNLPILLGNPKRFYRVRVSRDASTTN